MITIGDSRLSTVPAQVANCPPRPTLMLPARCAAANSAGSRTSRICAPDVLQREQAIERDRVHHAGQRLVERRPLAAVQHRVVGEVRRRVRLIGGHQLDERRLAHRLQRVVRAALLADRRERFLAQRLAAQRAGAVGGIDQALVGQRQQLVVQRVEQTAAQIGRRPAERDAQIRTADVADEQRVAGQHGVRNRVAAIEVEDEDRDRFGGVPGRLERGQADAAELDAILSCSGVKAYSALAAAPR